MQHKKQKPRRKTNNNAKRKSVIERTRRPAVRAAAGAVIGGVIAGPLGAALGAAVGATSRRIYQKPDTKSMAKKGGRRKIPLKTRASLKRQKTISKKTAANIYPPIP